MEDARARRQCSPLEVRPAHVVAGSRESERVRRAMVPWFWFKSVVLKSIKI